MKEKVIIFDIDGTLADISHRRELLIQGKKKEFYELMGNDEINPPVMLILESIQSYSKGIKFLFVTGRMEKHREKTADWIYNNTRYVSIEHEDSHQLLMRKNSDNRPDDIVKREIYEDHIKDKYDVIAVFDDRKRVIDMWISLGLFVFDVGQGKGDF